MMILSAFLSSAVMMSALFLLAGLGAVFSERAGVVNIGLEGMMLTGALMGAVGSLKFGSVWLGLLSAGVCSMILALVFAFFTVSLHGNQTITGAAINIIATGLTILIYRAAFGLNGEIPAIETISKAPVPVLNKIPLLGDVLFNQSIPVYIAFLMVPLCSFFMKKTNLGLMIRCVGNNPEACDTIGISVYRVRYGAILFSGLMSGFAGAFLSMGQLSFFTEGMTAGRGFIVLAAIALGNYTPVGVMCASLVFGISEALQYRLQVAATPIPTEIWAMLPYVVTLFAICVVYRTRSNRPVFSGRNFVR